MSDLHAAIRTVLRGFDEGVFVRSTDGDGNPAWAIKLFPFIQALAVLQQAMGEPPSVGAVDPQADNGNNILDTQAGVLPN